MHSARSIFVAWLLFPNKKNIFFLLIWIFSMFVLTVQFHIYSIHCREARLRPWGPIRLRATTQHSSACTRPLSPEFPVRFNETIVFRLVISHAKDLTAVDRDIRSEIIRFQLIQGSGNVVLAHTSSSLARILFPKYHSGDVTTIILTPTNKLMSIAGPRMEISTNMILEQINDRCQTNLDNYCLCDKKCWCSDWKIPETLSWNFIDPHGCNGHEMCAICEAYDRRFKSPLCCMTDN